MIHLDGKNIVDVQTISSLYDNNAIFCIDDNENFYRLKVDQLVKLFDGVAFSIVDKSGILHLEIDYNETAKKWEVTGR